MENVSYKGRDIHTYEDKSNSGQTSDTCEPLLHWNCRCTSPLLYTVYCITPAMRMLTQQQKLAAHRPLHTSLGHQHCIDCLCSCYLLLPQAHADVVSKFVKNGMSEHHKTHEVPQAATAGLTLN